MAINISVHEIEGEPSVIGIQITDDREQLMVRYLLALDCAEKIAKTILRSVKVNRRLCSLKQAREKMLAPRKARARKTKANR
jgi:hypothetical protein